MAPNYYHILKKSNMADHQVDQSTCLQVLTYKTNLLFYLCAKLESTSSFIGIHHNDGQVSVCQSIKMQQSLYRSVPRSTLVINMWSKRGRCGWHFISKSLSTYSSSSSSRCCLSHWKLCEVEVKKSNNAGKVRNVLLASTPPTRVSNGFLFLAVDYAIPDWSGRDIYIWNWLKLLLISRT